MIMSFKNRGTEDVFNGNVSKAAQRTCPAALWEVASRKLDQLDSSSSLKDLRVPPGNRLERLRGARDGQYSVRINRRYRICFAWSRSGPIEVEIVDYH